MKTLRPAIVLTLFFVVVTGLMFPIFVTGVSQAAFPYQANGSLLKQDDKPIGSLMIGQSFTSERFFHPRPSSGGYDANNSGGTNLGPTNPKLLTGAEGFEGVQQLASEYRKLNGVGEDIKLPADAVTRSASGLDPHISVENARLQASRVARANQLNESQVNDLIARNTEIPLFGLGEAPYLNVVKLNRTLLELR